LGAGARRRPGAENVVECLGAIRILAGARGREEAAAARGPEEVAALSIAAAPVAGLGDRGGRSPTSARLRQLAIVAPLRGLVSVGRSQRQQGFGGFS
jgi:hypothetical protein